MRIKSPLHQVSTPRRRFVQGVIAGGVLAAFPTQEIWYFILT